MVREASSRTFFQLLNPLPIQSPYFMFIYTMKLKINLHTPKHTNPQYVFMFQNRKLGGATAQPPYEDITLRYILPVYGAFFCMFVSMRGPFSIDFGNSSY